MITIEYAEDGFSVSDFYYPKVVQKIKELLAFNPEITLCYSSAVVFTAIRHAIANGEIPPNKIQFKYKDQIITVNEYGSIQNWPDGFCDHEQRMCEEILRSAMNKRRKEKEK